MTKRKPKLSTDDETFVKIVRAATIIGDGRARHIRNYKRLVTIIDKLTPKPISFGAPKGRVKC